MPLSPDTGNRSTLLGLLAILLWSATVALARSIAESIGPLAAGAAVYCTAGGILAVTFLITERSWRALHGLPRRYVLGCGALFVLYTLTLFEALALAGSRVQTIEVGLLNYLWPALTLVLSVPLLGNRASLWLVPGTAVALFGVVLAVTQGAISWAAFGSHLVSNPAAYGLGALAGVIWGLYSNLTRRWGGSGRGGVLLFTLATGLAFATGLLFQSSPGLWSPRVLAEIGCLALATATAYVCWDTAMRQGDLALVAACSYFTPLLSTVVSCVYLGVWPSASLWAGCGCVIAGSLLSWRSIRPGEADRGRRTVRRRRG
jgi:drug/metabolite transporter (DMT)-like permease